ncbi:MAG: hypothetical protein ABSD75_12885 [Terriglobales bacterium]|jgi:hypothetical protein
MFSVYDGTIDEPAVFEFGGTLLELTEGLHGRAVVRLAAMVRLFTSAHFSLMPWGCFVTDHDEGSAVWHRARELSRTEFYLGMTMMSFSCSRPIGVGSYVVSI